MKALKMYALNCISQKEPKKKKKKPFRNRTLFRIRGSSSGTLTGIIFLAASTYLTSWIVTSPWGRGLRELTSEWERPKPISLFPAFPNCCPASSLWYNGSPYLSCTLIQTSALSLPRSFMFHHYQVVWILTATFVLIWGHCSSWGHNYTGMVRY